MCVYINIYLFRKTRITGTLGGELRADLGQISAKCYYISAYSKVAIFVSYLNNGVIFFQTMSRESHRNNGVTFPPGPFGSNSSLKLEVESL